jgi:hypothetical protein
MGCRKGFKSSDVRGSKTSSQGNLAREEILSEWKNSLAPEFEEGHFFIKSTGVRLNSASRIADHLS